MTRLLLHYGFFLFLYKNQKSMKSNFREWTLDKIDEAFGMEQVWEMPLLTQWLGFQHQITPFEQQYLHQMQELFKLGGDDWNEVELENKFISPVITFSGIDNRRFAYFLERDLEATIGDYDLSGRVDAMVATGFRSPKLPYFCLSEYKRGTDPDGDPKGQALIAMLAAQHLNQNQTPIFGSYIIGRSWYFMTLIGHQYAISKDFSCADDELFDIFRVLKGLRWHIEQLLD
jgi:hypothetical protein